MLTNDPAAHPAGRIATGRIGRKVVDGTSLRVLRDRRFSAFWWSAVVSNAAAFMQMLAIPAVVYELTGKATWLGIVSMANLLPAVLITPYAGVLADRLSRRAILFVTQTVQFAIAFAYLGLYLGGALELAPIVVLSLVSGVASGFQVAVWQSFIPVLAPPDRMLDAVRMNSLQFMLGRALGPAIAVVAIKAWGVSAAFLINGITFIPVLGVLWRARAVTNATIASREPVRRVLADGARYTFTHAGIRLAVLLGLLIATLGQSLQGLTAALSKSVFGHASTDNAGLVAMVGVGALVASAITMTLEDRVARQKLVGVGLSIYVVSLALLPLTTNYWVGGFGFFLNGMAHLLCATTLNTMIQGTVPDHLRGRVLSFYLLGIMAGMPLSAQVMGLLGDVYGLRVVLAANAILMALIVLTVRLRGVLRVLDPEREAAPGHLTASAPAVAAT